jgi:hypothetical protein
MQDELWNQCKPPYPPAPGQCTPNPFNSHNYTSSVSETVYTAMHVGGVDYNLGDVRVCAPFPTPHPTPTLYPPPFPSSPRRPAVAVLCRFLCVLVCCSLRFSAVCATPHLRVSQMGARAGVVVVGGGFSCSAAPCWLRGVAPVAPVAAVDAAATAPSSYIPLWAVWGGSRSGHTPVAYRSCRCTPCVLRARVSESVHVSSRPLVLLQLYRVWLWGAAQNGSVSEADVDLAFSRVYTAHFALGLLDPVRPSDACRTCPRLPSECERSL